MQIKFLLIDDDDDADDDVVVRVAVFERGRSSLGVRRIPVSSVGRRRRLAASNGRHCHDSTVRWGHSVPLNWVMSGTRLAHPKPRLRRCPQSPRCDWSRRRLGTCSGVQSASTTPVGAWLPLAVHDPQSVWPPTTLLIWCCRAATWRQLLECGLPRRTLFRHRYILLSSVNSR